MFLAGIIPEISRNYAQKLIKENRVLIDGKAAKSKTKTCRDMTITVDMPAPEQLSVSPQEIPLDIVYEDSDIIIINKSRDMVIHPAPGNRDDTLVNALLYHCGDSLSDINGIIRPGIVHRLDKDTTGLLVVAKTTKLTGYFQSSLVITACRGFMRQLCMELSVKIKELLMLR